MKEDFLSCFYEFTNIFCSILLQSWANLMNDFPSFLIDKNLKTSKYDRVSCFSACIKYSAIPRVKKNCR